VSAVGLKVKLDRPIDRDRALSKFGDDFFELADKLASKPKVAS